jgi:RNA polymerase sigma factor (sigma-70 family)
VATTKDRALSRQLGTLFNLGAIRELTDGQLLERFARGDGEAAELAFAALVERHGAMVLRVCHEQLADPHETQDAFQATFLILVEKARGLWVRDSLGPWLHQVALRTASCARSAAIRRRRLERRAAEMADLRNQREDPDRSDLERVLHEEIARLPERYRIPIVLCDLEGRTCEEAARVMGRPVGTIKCWRARGRERLRRRLIRTGLAPSAVFASDAARAAVSRAMAEAVVRLVSDRMTAGAVPASVSMLVKGVIRSMFTSKLRMAVATLGVLTLIGSGLVAVARVAADDGKATSEGPRAAPSLPDSRVIPPTDAVSRVLGGESWPMSLREAVRIALDNSPIVRVIAFGAQGIPIGGFEPGPLRTATSGVTHGDPDPAQIVIAPLNADVDPLRFKAELMAEVRSVEQQYWNLSVAHVQLWAAERAVRLAEDILNREQAEFKAKRGTASDVAEAQQRLEQSRLNLVTRTSAVITTDRGLRNLLGLPPAGTRRIVPVTPPIEARLEPDWDKSRAALLENEPDILRARASVKLAEGRGNPVLLERQKAYLQQVVHQTTHSLARFFNEIDYNYKQLQAASRVRQAAAQRLDAMRADREAGRIPVNRFLDAVTQYVAAVGAEAQYRATYNISIVALEEAKGTLLEYSKITVAEGPHPRKAYIQARDIQNAHRQHHIPPDGSMMPEKPVGPANPDPTVPNPPPNADEPQHPPMPAPIGPIGPAAATTVPPPAAAGPSAVAPAAKVGDEKADAAGKTYSFQLTIGSGPRPLEIRGSFTVAPARGGR